MAARRIRLDRSGKRQSAVLFAAACIAVLWGACSAALTAPAESLSERFPRRVLQPGEHYTVYQLDVREDMIGEAMPFFIHRVIEAAKAAKADAIVMDLNTNGGSLEVEFEIRDEIIRLPMPLYAYVNSKAWSAGSLLAVLADRIVMAPQSSIGAAQIITGDGGAIPPVVEQKYNSALKGSIRAAAKDKGHPVPICEAFIDREIRVDGLNRRGEVLTLDQEQATTSTLYVDPNTSKTVVLAPLAAFVAKDMDDLLKHDGLWPAEVVKYRMSWSEQLAKWVLLFRPLLLLIGLGALFLELKAPGIGVPAAVGILALALFFWGSYLADLAGFLEVVLFVAGMALVALEIFVLPGTVLPGAAGVALVLISLVLSMLKLPPPDVPGLAINYGMLSHSLWTVVLVFAGLAVFVGVVAYFFPSIPLLGRLVLDPGKGGGSRAAAAEESLMGRVGEAITDLRPAGTALIGGRRVDVVTEGEYIERSATVRVIAIHGNVHTVARAAKE
jgi:membrane-bound serine protease (ClpP class)